MKIKNLFLLAALGLMASATLTSCDDILGEWSRPAPAVVTPSAIAVTSITLDADATINLGETKTLTATVAPDNATDKTVSWGSEDETVATVADGVVTAVAAGTTTITATANDGSGVKAQCTVTVKIPGLLAGVFSVSATEKVQFSQGNLQATYDGSAWTWAFAENQWDYIGGTTSASDASATTNNKIDGNGTVSVNGTVDLFGWVGASSNWGDIRMYGITSSDVTNAKDGYGDGATESLKSDWGTLAISNGGNTANSGWRTLTGGSDGEWEWILGPYAGPNPGTNCRTSSTIGGTVNARFVKATVHSTKGVIIFPDEITWNTTTMGTAPTTCNAANDDFTYSPSDDNWTALEAAGCVFLPVAGRRGGSSVSNAGSEGNYWSSSSGSDADGAYYVNFGSGNLGPASFGYRFSGFSVRLVYDVAE